MSEVVLVAGAGPVGLTMAAELRRYGVPVRVVEKAPEMAGQSRALFLWSRTLELLDRNGTGAELIAAGQKIEVLNILAGPKHIGRVDFIDIDSPHRYALMLPQAETERILAAHLAAQGLAIERGTELTGFTDTDTGVTVSLRHADGGVETVQAAYLVGCDGGGSFVRKTLGLSSSGPSQQSAWILADVELTGFSCPRTELTSFWHEEGFLGLFPLANGLYRVIADLHDVENFTPGEPSLAQVQEIVDRRGPGGVKLANPQWLSAFRIQERNVSSYRAGRVFLAGDAAHLHNPVGAQGLNMGIHDAVNLAWKLALVYRGAANREVLLESYNTERHAVAEHVVTNIGRAATVAVVHNPTVQFARNLLGNVFFGLAPARKAVAETLSEVSLGYQHSPLNANEDHAFPGPGPGDRVPPQPDQTPLGSGDSPRFALFAASSPAVEALRVEFAGLLEPALRLPLSPRCIWLARPDGYVAAAAIEQDIQQIEDYLKTYVTSADEAAVM